MNLEQHDPMADPTQLRALAAERLAGIARIEGQVELVHDPGDDVPLEQELGDIEGVDHVRAAQVEMGRLAGRQGQAAVGTDRYGHGEQRLGVGWGVGGEVLERPLELAGDGLDEQVRLRRMSLHVIQRLPGHEEQEEHDDRGDDRPDDLGEIVAVGLGRQLIVAGLAPVADDAPDDEPFDEEEDDGSDREDDVVEIVDRVALDRLRLRREEALQDMRSVQDHPGCRRTHHGDDDDPHEDRSGRWPRPGAARHQYPRLERRRRTPRRVHTVWGSCPAAWAAVRPRPNRRP